MFITRTLSTFWDIFFFIKTTIIETRKCEFIDDDVEIDINGCNSPCWLEELIVVQACIRDFSQFHTVFQRWLSFVCCFRRYVIIVDVQCSQQTVYIMVLSIGTKIHMLSQDVQSILFHDVIQIHPIKNPFSFTAAYKANTCRKPYHLNLYISCQSSPTLRLHLTHLHTIIQAIYHPNIVLISWHRYTPYTLHRYTPYTLLMLYILVLQTKLVA